MTYTELQKELNSIDWVNIVKNRNKEPYKFLFTKSRYESLMTKYFKDLNLVEGTTGNSIDKNLELFSKGKAKNLFNELTDISIDDKDFGLNVSGILNKYNEAWLESESNVIKQSVQSARDWNYYTKPANKNKMIRYQTSEDEKVRDSHRALNGLTLPVDHPFWKNHFPPFDYNCFDKETRVYTKDGFKYFKDVNINEDLFWTLDMESKIPTFQKAITYIEKEYNGDMINIKNKVVDLCTTPDHDILIMTAHEYKNNKELKKIKAKDISKSNKIYCSSEYKGVNKKFIKIGDIKVEPEYYAKLMGWYLSEGNSNKRNDNNYYYVKISQSPKKYLDLLYEDLSGETFNFYKASEYIGTSNEELSKYLMKFGKSFEKYIPEEVLHLDLNNLKIFLDRFTKGDGSFYGDNFSISSSSEKMIYQLIEVAIKCGYSVSYNKFDNRNKLVTYKNGKSYYSNHIQHTIYCMTTQAKSIFNQKDKNSKSHTIINYNDKVYCVEVPNGTLLVERNGRIAWCGNCRCTTLLVKDEEQSDEIPEVKTSKGLTGNVGQTGVIFTKEHSYLKK